MIRLARTEERNFITNEAAASSRFGPYVPVFNAMLDGDHTVLRRHGVRGDVELFLYEDAANQRAGFVAVEWIPGIVHIHGVVVDERIRRHRVATNLINHVEQLARKRGIVTLECNTAETGNFPALRCFEQWGRHNEGLAGRYPNGQRAVRLRRILEP